MLDKNITMDDVHFALKNAYNDDIELYLMIIMMII